MHFHWTELVSGYFALGAIKYALKTFPAPESKLGRWGLGVAQYLAMNWDKGSDHFRSPDSAPEEIPTIKVE